MIRIKLSAKTLAFMLVVGVLALSIILQINGTDATLENITPTTKQQLNFRKNSVSGTEPPSTGDWIITQDTLVENENITIAGNIRVSAGNTLELKNSIIYLSLGYSWNYYIWIEDNASLVLENATIQPTNGHFYTIHNNGMFYATDSEIDYCLFTTSSDNIYISNSVFYNTYKLEFNQATNVTIVRNVIYSDTNITTLSMYKVTNSIIYNNTFYSTNLWAISIGLENCENITIEKNTIHTQRTGVLLRGTKDVTIKNNKVYAINEALHSVEVYDSHNLYIFNNTLSGSFEISVYIYGENNTVTTEANEVSGFKYGGILYDHTTNGTITNNIVHDGNEGISIHNSQNIVVRGGTSYNTTTDIRIQYSANVTVESMNLSPLVSGIIIGQGTNITIVNNKISTNNTAGHGIEVGESQNILLSNNTISGLFETSIMIYNCNDTVTTDGNEIYGFKYEGIRYEHTSNGVSINNILHDGHIGTYVNDSQNTVVSHNIYYNLDMGVYITNSKNTEITNTTCYASLVGINEVYDVNTTIDNVQCYSNLYGIYLIYSKNVTIKHSNIRDNDAGIVLTDAINVQLYNVNLWYDGIVCTYYSKPAQFPITIDNTTTVNGLPVVSYHDLRSIDIRNETFGELILFNVNDTTITEVNAIQITAFYVSNVSVTDVYVSGGDYGIFTIGATDFYIANARIENITRHGIVCAIDTNVIIEEITAVDIKAYGINIYQSNVRIKNAQFEKIAYLQIYMSDVYVYGVTVYHSMYGILLISSNTKVTNCKFEDAEYGIYIFDYGFSVSNITIESTVLTQIRNTGIYSSPFVNDLSITNVTFYNNSISAITITQGSNISIINNTITDTETGIMLYGDVNYVTIRQNVLKNTSHNGIYIEHASSITIEENHFELTTFGINMTGANEITIRANEIYNATDSGVLIVGSNNVTVTNNTISYAYYGVHIINSTNITVENNTITDCTYGIYSPYSVGVHIRNNYVTNSQKGIVIEGDSQVAIVNNTIENNAEGITVIEGSLVNVSNNQIQNNEIIGLSLENSSNVTVTQNTFVNDSLAIEGTSEDLATIVMDETNSINGQPLVYYYNKSYIELVNVYVGHIVLVNVTNVYLENVTTSGIELYYVTNATIINCILNNSDYGIIVRDSSVIYITENIIMNNAKGVLIANTEFVTITNNTFVNSGLWISGTPEQISTYEISGNIINGYPLVFIFNESDIVISNVTAGEIIIACSNNVTLYNIISNGLEILNSKKITVAQSLLRKGNFGVYIVNSLNVVVTKNTISDNIVGLYQENSNTTIYLNNFIENTIQALDDDSYYYDNGMYGNYWDDYIGTDINLDRHGDTPYYIDDNSLDRYPLLAEYPDTIPPTIYQISIAPENPSVVDNVTVIANIGDKSGVLEVILSYTLDNITWINITMIYNSTSNVYMGIIPATYHTTTVYYMIYARDVWDNWITSPIYFYNTIDTTPPEIENVTQLPDTPSDIDYVKITAEISDNIGIYQAILSFFDGNSWQNITMDYLGNNTYIALIPPESFGIYVYYKIIAIDLAGNVAISPMYMYIISTTTVSGSYIVVSETQTFNISIIINASQPITVNITAWVYVPENAPGLLSLLNSDEVVFLNRTFVAITLTNGSENFNGTLSILLHFYYREEIVTLNNVSETQLGLYYWNATTETWQICENNSVDTSNNEIYGEVSTLTMYMILADVKPPRILNISQYPEEPTSEDQVIITAEFEDFSGVKLAILSYFNGTVWINVTMQKYGDLFIGVIPALPTNTTVYYKIYVCDFAGNWNVSEEHSYTVKPKIEILFEIQIITRRFIIDIVVARVDGKIKIFITITKRT